MIRHKQLEKPYGIWIRVSTEDQARGDSPEHHEHRARCYAEAKGWKVAEVYRLEGVSGAAVADHPEMRRMMADVESGHIGGLVFSKLARLARSTKHLLELADFFQEHGADLISLQESIDTSTPAGRLFYTIIAAMAQWEREEIADRVKASVPVRAKLGKPLGGASPFGYQWVDKKLVPHPEEAPIRRRVHELFREHRRRKTVARLLNEAGYRTRNGSKFSDTTVTRLLEDPTAKGWHRANYTTADGGSHGWNLKPEDEWVYHEVEPIVSEELWDECKAIIDGLRTNRKKPAKKTAHLFAGLLFCQCGKKMYVPNGSRKYVCTKCRNKIAIEDMDAIFIEQLKGFLLSPDDIEQYLNDASSSLVENEATIRRLQKEHRQVSEDIDTLFKLCSSGEIPTEGFGKRYQPLYDRQGELERGIAEAEATVDLLKVESLSSDFILKEGQTLADSWPKLNRDERRQIVEDLVDEIVIGDEEVAINLLYFPSSKETAKGQQTKSDSSQQRA